MKNHRPMPQVMKYMTVSPHTIGSDIDIKKAQQIMREYRIRHLPVQTGGELVGVISDRDIKAASALEGSERLLVEDVMTSDPYTCPPETPLSTVISNMAEHKYGCAIIQQQNGKVVGIFTENDGMKTFAEILTKNYAVFLA